ncbi:MAG: DUF3858 domain-containing protein [Taibaiella sp.]|nr:DUF3858 domain-containing protein [Taibaiella sp.]
MQKTELEKILQLTSGSILSSSKAIRKSVDPKIDLQANIDVHSFGTQMSDRWLIPVFVYGRNTLVLNNTTRKNPFEIQRSVTEILKTKIHIPENYEIIRGDDIVLDTKFGKYILSIIQNDRDIEIERRLIFNKGTFPAADYENFVSFINAVNKYDHSSLVLKNKS